ncbi:MAG: serpin family protein [Oscillospiraceae bacterium]|nr:serpin family protein [Oscillospiraceae bacterium]
MKTAGIKAAALICTAALCMPFAACGKQGKSGGQTVQAADLTKDIKPQSVTDTAPDEQFCAGQTAFALHLMQETLKEDSENVLISPYSVMQALAMTANGAKGETLSQMEQVLGGIPVGSLNGYLHKQRSLLPDTDECRFRDANSVWFRDDASRLTMQQDFLQTTADYYGADAFKAPFDDSTLNDVNNWISDRTAGRIPKMLDRIGQEDVIYLVNAVVFDAKWESPYDGEEFSSVEFTALNGKTQTANMMFFDEYTYLSDVHATGFVKPYQGGQYAFAALLPEEGLSVTDYVAGLTPESLRETLTCAQHTAVDAGLPAFSYDFDAELSPMLKSMGMTDAFDPDIADLTGMASSSNGNIYISQVLHKTHIDVNTEGTSAAAATVVTACDSCALPEDVKHVTLDRPFLYMIIDTENSLPVFMGVLTELP